MIAFDLEYCFVTVLKEWHQPILYFPKGLYCNLVIANNSKFPYIYHIRYNLDKI